jgi:hypothetical protein
MGTPRSSSGSGSRSPSAQKPPSADEQGGPADRAERGGEAFVERS